MLIPVLYADGGAVHHADHKVSVPGLQNCNCQHSHMLLLRAPAGVQRRSALRGAADHDVGAAQQHRLHR